MKRFLPFVLLVSGCNSAPELWALKDGWKQEFSTRNGLTTFVETFRISGRVPVNGVYGFELQSSMGVSRLGWKGDTLYASAFPNTRFSPPIPILVRGVGKLTKTTECTVISNGNKVKANVSLVQSEDEVVISTASKDCIRTHLTIQTPTDSVVVVSQYVPGLGLYSQSQSTNNELDYTMERIN